MTSQTDKGVQPTDPTEAADASPAAASTASAAPGAVPADDTEGHSLLTVELDRSNRQDRARETDRIVRDSARAKEAHGSTEGGWFKRFRRG
jgi:hypothetical protein